jgi:hypothetical protein
LIPQFDSKKAMLALATVSLFACGGAAGGAASDSMKFLPEGSTGVMVIDVKKALASPILKEEPFKSEIEKAKNEGEFKKLVEAGLDPFTNLNTVVFAGKDFVKEDFVIILSGSFDANKVAEKAKTEIKDEKVKVEVLGTGMLAMGPKASVDSAKAGKGLDGSPDVKGMLSLADNSKTMFAVGVVPAAMLSELPPNAPPQAKNLKGIGFSIDASSGIALSGLARFGAAEDATEVKKVLDGLLPMGAMMGAPQELISAIKIEAKGADISVTFSLTAAQVSDAIKKATMQQPMPSPAPGVEVVPPVAPGVPAAPGVNP